MKYIFIINPAAGKRKLQKHLLTQIQLLLPPEEYQIFYTACPGDGQRLAAQAVQANRDICIFACGGDGTFFEVINGAAGQVPIGILPCGSGNDFIKNIVPADSLLNVSAQLRGKTVPLDLIRCNGRYISNVCNIGFDADIAHNMNRFKGWPLISGKKAYLISAIYCFLYRLRGYSMTIQLDDQPPINGTFLFALLANGQTYGGSFRGAPLASVQDGLMDVCLCKQVSRLILLRLLRPFQKGTYLQKKSCAAFIQYQKCQNVQITLQTPTITGFDGNITTSTLLEAELIPAAMQLLIPQNATLR